MNLDHFRGPHYRALLERARRELERRDGQARGGFTLKGLDEQDVAHVHGLLGTEPGRVSDQVRVDLAVLDATLRDGYGIGLGDLLERVGPPLRLKSKVEEERSRLRSRILAPALASHLHETDWFRAWLEDPRTRGAITQRVTSADTDGLGRAVRVLETIDAHDTGTTPLLLPNLAVRVTGDTKALNNDRPLATLVLAALSARSAQERPETAEERRALWEAYDVVQDDLASRVLVLNLPARGPVLGSWMNEAAEHGLPLQVTLQQLVRFPPEPSARVIHVCENPAVLRQAA
ncbi:TIGR02679 domain-containing protein [Nocardiopsis sp. MG754419]|uniref:TIGR02679 domain-containing protein n=1 Tax=Nocardiopsis sp. MG754419 TaxID=2259865 RepID=UPI0027DC3CA9|nr:TIGR02679 domain-containing protein [Nocardiopsis sp. MG754419]